MQVLLFANRPGTALLPLTEHTCTAMLPIVGKPLVVFAIEDLVYADIREALVVVSTHAELIEQELGNGTRWGMRLEYVIAHPDETPERIVAKVAGQLSEQFLMMRGDLLRTPLLKQFLALASGSTQATEAVYGGEAAAIRLCRQSVPESWRLGGDPERPSSPTPMMQRTELPDGKVASIATLTDYHRANLDAAAGHFVGLIVPGREMKPGVRSGRQTRLPASAIKGISIFVGSRCRVDRTAELMDNVVISDDVIIDRHSTLSSAVILPHTYIGELVDVSDSIVSSNYLISVPGNSVTRVVDSFLLSGLKPITYTRGIGAVMHRVLGLITLLLSIPLWPLMFIASLMADLHRPFRRLILVGNKIERTGGIERRRSFVAFEAATSIPPLKWIPLLLAVVSGNLRMIGGEAISPEREAALESAWERLREEAPIGLVGPVCLAVGRDAPEEEKRVVEGYYARTRSGWSDLMLLGTAIRALFKPSSWIPAPRGVAPAKQELSAI